MASLGVTVVQPRPQTSPFPTHLPAQKHYFELLVFSNLKIFAALNPIPVSFPFEDTPAVPLLKVLSGDHPDEGWAQAQVDCSF